MTVARAKMLCAPAAAAGRRTLTPTRSTTTWMRLQRFPSGRNEGAIGSGTFAGRQGPVFQFQKRHGRLHQLGFRGDGVVFSTVASSKIPELEHRVFRYVFCFLEEKQGVCGGVVIDADQVAAAYLPARDQVGKGIDQFAFHGAPQVSSAVLKIRSFAQQEVFGGRRKREKERRGRGGTEDPLLQQVELEI